MSGIFILGEEYCNRFGRYTVVTVNEPMMTVEYLDGEKTGTKQTLEMKGQEKVYRNMMREMARLFPNPVPSYFQALGYLARYGRLDAEVPMTSQAAFESRYHAETGERAAGHRNYVLLSGENKWGAELRVYFPTRSVCASFCFGANVDVVASTQPGESRINNNGLWWRLVAVGFRLGGTQDVGRIRGNIPADRQADFDAGTSL